MTTSNSNLALLIDADNVSSKVISSVIDEIAKYGTATVRRLYGDWTNPNLKGWKACLLEHSITPMQQFAYTTGKNATDGAMIIDAMDLLYTGRFNGFCLVSSDSDFTRLASRIREQGVMVYGFGERKTPKALISACNRFTYFDALAGGRENEGPHHVPPDPLDTTIRSSPLLSLKRSRKEPLDQVARDAIEKAVESCISASSGDGWTRLSNVGDHLTKLRSDMNERNFGYKRLKDLMADSGMVDLKLDDTNIRGSNTIMVRLKQADDNENNEAADTPAPKRLKRSPIDSDTIATTVTISSEELAN